MLKILRIGLCSFFCLSASACLAFAEEVAHEEGYEAYSLGDVYVTEKTPVTQQTTVTNVITSEEIKATNSRTVGEALAYTPGMRFSVGAKNEGNVSIRGFFDQTRILVMIDGVPYYETKSGKLDLNQLTTDNVAKIEVTKGAASVLYGANALGGVINIITKQPSGKPYYALELEGGDVDYFKTSISHGMKKGIFSYWLNYDHRQAHGWRMSSDFEPRTGTVSTYPPSGPAALSYGVFEDGGTRNQSDYKTDNIWAKFGLTPAPGSEYFLSFHYIEREKGNPPAVNSVNVRQTFSNFFRFRRYDDWGLDLSGQQKINDKLSLNAKLFYHNHVDGLDSYRNWTFDQPFANGTYRDFMLGGSLITVFQPVEWNTMRVAFNYRGDSHKDRDFSYQSYNEYFSYLGSVGIEDEFRIGRNFNGVLGASYDWFKVTDGKKLDTSGVSHNITPPPAETIFNPMAGFTYQFADSTKLFSSVASKNRFPTIQQLFSSDMGNDKLKPEQSVNTTVGVSRSFGPLMWAELALFYHYITDYIVKVGSGRYTYENLSEVRIHGLELSTEFYPLEDLTLRLGYNYNNANDLSPNKVTDLVAYVPEHKLDMGLTYTAPVTRTRLDLTGILMGSLYSRVPSAKDGTTEKTSGWFVLNARVSQKFLTHYEAFLAVNNIFDRDYEIEKGFPAQGRNIFGGISARF